MELQKSTKTLIEELKRIEVETSNISRRAFQSIILCREQLSMLRKQVTENGFEGEVEEIRFFKEVKHAPLTNLIYHTEVHNFEIFFPKGTLELQRACIQKQLTVYNDFFLSNIDFGQYLQMDATHFDSYYYTRKPLEQLPIGSNRYLQDPEFNTPKDALLAQFKAYDKMVRYLKDRLTNLLCQNPKDLKNVSFNLQCTASKTDIVELVYALIASGAIQGDLKELVKAFELIFDMELGDFYRTYIALSNRSIDPTKFLDTLRVALLKRMEEADS